MSYEGKRISGPRAFFRQKLKIRFYGISGVMGTA
jgi:hypothetical protein